jgi:hypothetical protein
VIGNAIGGGGGAGVIVAAGGGREVLVTAGGGGGGAGKTAMLVAGGCVGAAFCVSVEVLDECGNASVVVFGEAASVLTCGDGRPVLAGDCIPLLAGEAGEPPPLSSPEPSSGLGSLIRSLVDRLRRSLLSISLLAFALKPIMVVVSWEVEYRYK